MITVSARRMAGNCYIGENALPKFRARAHEKILDGSRLREEEKVGYGYETGDRVLPYKWQDLYSREMGKVEIRTIILENDHLRAEFWPDYGMRLMSLYDKDRRAELLFNNPVLQFGNLAIRRAWFSGGIEWNCGQLGHTFTTCSPVFAARVTGEDGQEFLRAWEYERQKGLYWALDFHLGPDDRQLWVYGRVVNPHSVAKPFYWWTNIAVREEEGMRIFSGTGEVIFIDSDSLMSENALRVMAHGHLPHLGIREGVDYSYPENFTDYSNEYFFQNQPLVEESWEAASYRSGEVFFDRADGALCYHKMFCWGGEPGGRHWRKYLSPSHDGAYVELQAGAHRTQVHGGDIAASSTFDFVQCFGTLDCAPSFGEGDYDERRKAIYSEVDRAVGTREVEERKAHYRELACIEVSQILSSGSGFGALEELRHNGITPRGLSFPVSSLKGEAAFWLDVLEGRAIPDEEIPSSFMTDLNWRPILEKVCHQCANGENLLGVMLLENEIDSEAQAAFNRALAFRPNAFSYRCLAVMAHQRGDLGEAIHLMEKAVSLDCRREYAEEYADLLVEAQRWQEEWDFYESLPEAVRADERLTLSTMPSACHLGKYDFLKDCYSREFAVIREGERNYTESWYSFQAMEKARREDLAYTEELVDAFRAADEIPPEHDFRLG